MYFTAKEFATRRAAERGEQLLKQREKEDQAHRRQEEHQKVITDLFEQLRATFRTLIDDYNEVTPEANDKVNWWHETHDINQNKLVPSARLGWQATLHDQGCLASRDNDRIILQFYSQKDEEVIGGQFHYLMPIVENNQLTETVKLEGTNGQLLLRTNDKPELIKQVAALCLFKLVNLADNKLLDLNESMNITLDNIRLQLREPALKL